MRLRRLMGVADQIVAYRFSSIDLSNKALCQCHHRSNHHKGSERISLKRFNRFRQQRHFVAVMSQFGALVLLLS